YATPFPGQPDNPLFDLFLSRMDFHRGDIEGARTRARGVLERFPSEAPVADLATKNLIAIEYMTGHLDEASRLVDVLIQRDLDPTMRAMTRSTRFLLDGSVDGDLQDILDESALVEEIAQRNGHTRYVGICRNNMAY